MKKILATVVLGFLLTSCFATTAKYESALDTWMGQTEDHLIEKWGVPNGAYNKNDGGKVLTFVVTGSMFFPGTSSSRDTYYSWGEGTTTTVETSPGTIIPLRCKTTFIISPSGRITSWSYEGNHCVSNS